MLTPASNVCIEKLCFVVFKNVRASSRKDYPLFRLAGTPPRQSRIDPRPADSRCAESVISVRLKLKCECEMRRRQSRSDLICEVAQSLPWSSPQLPFAGPLQTTMQHIHRTLLREPQLLRGMINSCQPPTPGCLSGFACAALLKMLPARRIPSANSV